MNLNYITDRHKYSAFKFLPLSVKMLKGKPNLAKNSLTAALAVTSAVCDANGTHSAHFVNWSTITNMLVFPAVDLGNEPKKSR